MSPQCLPWLRCGVPGKGYPPCGSLGDCWGSAACGFHRWRGDYGGKKQLWFPSNYVEEMVSPAVLEPEREVRLELLAEQESHPQLPCAHTVICACACIATPHVRSSQPWCPWSPTYTCTLIRCICCMQQTSPHTHVYRRPADEPVGFASHSTWTRTAPWGTCCGGCWMFQLVRSVSPILFSHPLFLRVSLSPCSKWGG